ncbi:hypothetical protein AAVH_08326 [Aphelenchoides avenae]|nr:hypothetical protein AAVH_08326 [Aphelenchus avenae]
MCFTKPVQDASSPVVSSTQTKFRKVEEGWTPRGPGVWTDEEYDSSEEVYFVQAPIKPVQKKPSHVIRHERAECSLKRAETFQPTPKPESHCVKIMQKKRFVPQTTPTIVRKVRDIVYSRDLLLKLRSVALTGMPTARA